MVVLCAVLFIMSFPHIYQSVHSQQNLHIKYLEDRIVSDLGYQRKQYYSELIDKIGSFKESKTMYYRLYNLYKFHPEIRGLRYFIYKLNGTNNNFEMIQENVSELFLPHQYFYIFDEGSFFLQQSSQANKPYHYKEYHIYEGDTDFPPQRDYQVVDLKNRKNNEVLANITYFGEFDAFKQYDLSKEIQIQTKQKLRLKGKNNIITLINLVRLEFVMKGLEIQDLAVLSIDIFSQYIKNIYKSGFCENFNIGLMHPKKDVIHYFENDKKIPISLDYTSLPKNKLIFFEYEGEEYFIMRVTSNYLSHDVVVWELKSKLMGADTIVITERDYHIYLLSIILVLLIGAGIRLFVTKRIHHQLAFIFRSQSHQNTVIPLGWKNILDSANLLNDRTKIIARHLPGGISGYLLDHKNQYPEEKCMVGCLVIDLKGFTFYSENRSNFNLTCVLNEYYDICVRVVRANGGTVDKFIGDSVEALWTQGTSQEISMKMIISASEISQLFNQSELLHKTEMAIRIGIDIQTGYLGVLGSESRLCFTALGDSINFARELELMSNIYQSEILLSERVASGYKKQKNNFIIRWIDQIEYNERQEKIYELIRTHTSSFALVSNDKYLQLYEKALKQFVLKRYTRAYELFSNIQSVYPSDYVVQVLISRCKKLLNKK